MFDNNVDDKMCSPNGRRNVKTNHISYVVATVNTDSPRGLRNAGIGTTVHSDSLRQHHVPNAVNTAKNGQYNPPALIIL